MIWGGPMKVFCTVLCPAGHACHLVYGHGGFPEERRHYCRVCDRQF